LPFSGHAPATQCPSCSEGLKNEHSIKGVCFSGDIQDPPRPGPVQPAVGELALAGGLD